MALAPKKKAISAKENDKRTTAKRMSARKKDLDKKKTFLRNGKRPKSNKTGGTAKKTGKAFNKTKPMNFKNAADSRKRK